MKFFLISLANASGIDIDLIIDNAELLALINKEYATCRTWQEAFDNSLIHVNAAF